MLAHITLALSLGWLLVVLFQGLLNMHTCKHVRLIAPIKCLVDETELLLQLNHLLTLVLVTIKVTLDVGGVTEGTFHFTTSFEHFIDVAETGRPNVFVVLVEFDSANNTISLVFAVFTPEEIACKDLKQVVWHRLKYVSLSLIIADTCSISCCCVHTLTINVMQPFNL